MRAFLKTVVAALMTLVILSYATGYGYVWQGMRETYLRGYKNANIDDLPFRTTSKLEATQPAPWPERLLPVTSLNEDDAQWIEDGMAASYLVFHRDTLVYERYWRGHDEQTLTNSFSMAKTITALGVGLAVTEGLIDVKKPVSTYLPRFASGAGADLTVEELLQMRSSIPFSENYKNPFGFMAKAYYGKDVRSLLQPFSVAVKEGEQAGKHWKYEGGNTMLLEEILASVSKKPLASWVEDGLWNPMGAEHDAFWGLDAPEEEGGVARCFAQYYASSRDYARLGKLLLHGGKWENEQLVDSTFIADLRTPIADLTDECDVRHYGYQCWMGVTDDGLPFQFFDGLHGQYIIAVPALDLVVVRTGYGQPSKAKLRSIYAVVYRYIEMAREQVTE